MNENHFGGMTELMQAAVQLHELFTSLMIAGFTEQQALYLIGQHIIAAGKGGTA